ncbi:MAG: hypothetical protein QOG39_1610, partial [Acidimicrobiaceae bacterium]
MVAVVSTLLVVAGLGVAPGARASGEGVATPRIEGPITGGIHGHPLFDSWFDLAPFGYTDAEYFVSGTAASSAGTTTAPYKTRIMVTRPTDPNRFN